MDVLLLGPIEARLDDRPIMLGALKERAVLAMLALEVGHTVSADRLTHGLWGERAPPSAPKLVQLYVSHLRRLLDGDGAQIVTRGRGYELRLVDGEVDAVRFERLLEQGRARDALALWRGEALADVADEPFAGAEIRRLEELRVRAAELAIEVDLEAGRHGEVIAELAALVEAHPLRERLHAQRMLALYRAGRQAEALEAYRQARALLVEQIGVEPGPELKQLHAAVLAQDAALAPAAPVGPASRVRGHAERRGRALLVTSAAVLFAGLVAFGINRVTRTDGLARIAENAVGVIESDSGAITTEYPVGQGPVAVTTGGGSLWVASALDGTVTRIDGDNVVPIHVDGAPAGLAFGRGSLWVTDGASRYLTQVDARTNRVQQRLEVGNAPRALAFADGALWVASGSDAAIERLDLDRARVTSSVRLASNPTAIAAGAGALWVSSEEAGTVTRIDPRTRSAGRPIPVGNGPTAVAVGDAAVWVVNRHDGTLSRIDPVTSAVTWTDRVGSDPTAVTVGNGAVWVAGGGGTVTRVDSDPPRVRDTIDIGSPATAIATAGGGVWAATGVALAAHRGGTLRVLYRADVPHRLSIDWLSLAGYDWRTQQLTSLAYDGLVAYRRVHGTSGTTLVGGLATEAPQPSGDGRTYAFTLRPGLRYSDGRPVQPEDFRASLERLLRVTRDRFTFYDRIVGARSCARVPARCDLSAGIVTDRRARTITVHLTRPDAEFLHKLTLPQAYVVPATTPVRRTGDRAPPGTGPYRFAAWVSRRGGQLVRNRYFRSWSPRSRPAGFADRIEVSVRPDDAMATQIADVERGEADVAVLADPFHSHVQPAQLAALTARAPGQLHRSPVATTSFMFLNVRMRPFDDLRVRRALNHATDRSRVAELTGSADVAMPTCQFVPPALRGYEPYCRYGTPAGPGNRWKAADRERARRLIAASGRAGEPVVVWTPPSEKAIGRYFVNLLDELGFRASLHAPRTAYAYFDELLGPRTRAQIGFQAWTADYLSASNFIEPFFACPQGAKRSIWNWSYFCDPGVTQEIEQAFGSQGAEAAGHWAAADRRIADRAPAVPLTNQRDLVFVSKRVGNVQHHPLWLTLLDQLWVR
jgi:ABC-type transport system substrate-binding protein/DNA-binding SARP family transcriptional activator